MSLKRCPLCGAINSNVNCECFVCSWHGEFVDDPDLVVAGLDELLGHCPELVEAMVFHAPARSNVFSRIQLFFSRLFSRSKTKTEWLVDF